MNPDSKAKDECWWCGDALDPKEAVQITYRGQVYNQACLQCAIINDWPGINKDNLDACENWRTRVEANVVYHMDNGI